MTCEPNLAPEITELKKAYALVQDLDVVKYSSTFKSHSNNQTHLELVSQRSQGQTSTHKANTKGKSVENKDKGIDKEFTIKCYKCLGYGHVAANCSSPIKIALVNGVSKVASD